MPKRQQQPDWFGTVALFIILFPLLALLIDIYLESPPALDSLAVSVPAAAAIILVVILIRRRM